MKLIISLESTSNLFLFLTINLSFTGTNISLLICFFPCTIFSNHCPWLQRKIAQANVICNIVSLHEILRFQLEPRLVLKKISPIQKSFLQIPFIFFKGSLPVFPGIGWAKSFRSKLTWGTPGRWNFKDLVFIRLLFWKYFDNQKNVNIVF